MMINTTSLTIAGTRLPELRLGMGSGMVHTFGLAFQRHVDVLYETCVLRLTEWTERSERLGTVQVARSHLTVPARDAFRFGHGHIDVRLGRGLLRPSLPMELHVVRWSSAFGSVLELHPARGVRPDARYYREGNAMLDRLTAVIEGRSV